VMLCVVRSVVFGKLVKKHLKKRRGIVISYRVLPVMFVLSFKMKCKRFCGKTRSVSR